MFGAGMSGISPEGLTAIFGGAVAILTSIGSIVAAIVSSSKSASVEQVKELKDWVKLLNDRLDEEIEEKKQLRADLDQARNDLKEIRAERDRAETDARNMKKEVEELSAQLQKKNHIVAAQDKKIREQDKKLMEQDEQISAMAREIEGLKTQVKTLAGGRDAA